jgi:chromosome segregation ATPase
MSVRTRFLHAALVALIGLTSGSAWPQSGDKNAEKAARRSQLMMQNLQQQLQDAQAAKAKVEADKAAADKQLVDQTKQLSQLKGALPRVSQSLKAAETERARLSASVAALEKQLADQKAAADTALAAKGRDIEQLTKARDEQLAQSRRSLDERGTQVAECTSRNERLIRLNAELLDRYRGKTTAGVLKQREPFLGFQDVEMFNIVQDYRDKADAERYSPPSTGETRPK